MPRQIQIKVLIMLFMAEALWAAQNVSDPAMCQLALFKEKTVSPVGTLTTSAGAPVECSFARSSLNTRLLHNDYLIESLTHLARERLPERFVHAKGAGGFGFFEVTHDITHISNAVIFREVGKKTPVAARFSGVIPESGGVDTFRDPRGFAIKFYTDVGNLDIVGFNTPMFIVKDPLLFPTFVRSFKRNPVTHLIDHTMRWDMMTQKPESFHLNLIVFSDRGIPDGYRQMPGFGIHSFQVVNKNGETNFIRFKFTPKAGIKNLFSDQAAKVSASDPDYAIRDLYNAIAKGHYPTWYMHIQVVTPKEAEKEKEAGLDIFDVTKTIPVDRYPLIPVGKLVLNRNPKNYFAEVEQLAFCPGNLIPYILGSPDKMFESRRFSYRDAHNYRLGANHNKIRVNRPIHDKVFTYNRDGVPPVEDNGNDSPNYYPNTFNGPVPYVDKHKVDLIEITEDLPNNFDQMTELYNNEFTKDERHRLAENIADSLGQTPQRLQEKAFKLFQKINPDLRKRVQQELLKRNSTQCNG